MYTYIYIYRPYRQLVWKAPLSGLVPSLPWLHQSVELQLRTGDQSGSPDRLLEAVRTNFKHVAGLAADWSRRTGGGLSGLVPDWSGPTPD